MSETAMLTQTTATESMQTEAEEFRGYVACWVDERLVPQAEALDHAGVFPHELDLFRWVSFPSAPTGYDIRTVQDLLGQADVATGMRASTIETLPALQGQREDNGRAVAFD
jgi:hypothetical protein